MNLCYAKPDMLGFCITNQIKIILIETLLDNFKFIGVIARHLLQNLTSNPSFKTMLLVC